MKDCSAFIAVVSSQSKPFIYLLLPLSLPPSLAPFFLCISFPPSLHPSLLPLPLSLPLFPLPSFPSVCDDHHFKDEYLFYRFKNDEKPKSPKVRSASRKKVGTGTEDSGSYGEPTENRTSGNSWESVEVPPTPPPEEPESDE